MARRRGAVACPPRMSNAISHVALLACAMLLARVAGADARRLTSFTVETADLQIKAPASLAKTYDMAIANFGEPLYGATLRCASQPRPARPVAPSPDPTTRDPNQRTAPDPVLFRLPSQRRTRVPHVDPPVVQDRLPTLREYPPNPRPPARPLPRTHQSNATGEKKKPDLPLTRPSSPPPRRISPPATSSRNRPAPAPPSSSSTAGGARSPIRRITRNPRVPTPSSWSTTSTSPS